MHIVIRAWASFCEISRLQPARKCGLKETEKNTMLMRVSDATRAQVRPEGSKSPTPDPSGVAIRIQSRVCIQNIRL